MCFAMKINATKLINEAGGSTALFNALMAAGNPVSIRTIESWKNRGSLSLNGYIMVQEAIKTNHLTIQLENYYVNTPRANIGITAEKSV